MDASVIIDIDTLRELIALAEATGITCEKTYQCVDEAKALLEIGNQEERIGLKTDGYFVEHARELHEEGWLRIPDAPLLNVKDRTNGAWVQAWVWSPAPSGGPPALAVREPGKKWERPRGTQVGQ